MKAISAGVLLFRRASGALEVLLAHPGGPYWSGRDAGVWSVPKGLVEPGESLLEAARREFREETGFDVEGEFLALGSTRLASGKEVHVWALERDLDAALAVSNEFEMEWPKGSGIIRRFPEMDQAAWFAMSEARRKIAAGQRVFLERLEAGIPGVVPDA